MKTLVIYYSRSGNTRMVARRIADALGGEIEELTDQVDRKGIVGYLRSGREAFLGRRAKLNPIAADLSSFDLVVIGTPVWNASLSSPIRTFLQDHAAALPRVAFFCTLGGRGRDRVLRQMEQICGKAPLATLGVTEKMLNHEELTVAVDSFASRLSPPVETRRPYAREPAPLHA